MSSIQNVIFKQKRSLKIEKLLFSFPPDNGSQDVTEIKRKKT